MTAPVQPTTPDEVVIDTNVVLDWLLFDDPFGKTIGAEVLAGRWRWIGTDAMLKELAIVVSRPGLERWQARIGAVLSEASILCQRVEHSPLAVSEMLRCSDPDDQKFIDLALIRRVPWLLTRDKALLRLARKSKALGTSVLRPSDWTSALP